MTEQAEVLSAGDARARVAVLEAELAELRTRNAGLQRLYKETEDELLDKVRENGLLRNSLAAAPAPVGGGAK